MAIGRRRRRGLDLGHQPTAILAGYAEAWTAATGIERAGPAESAAARLVSWLAETPRPWLVVLDDLLDADELDGLWPAGPAES